MLVYYYYIALLIKSKPKVLYSIEVNTWIIYFIDINVYVCLSSHFKTYFGMISIIWSHKSVQQIFFKKKYPPFIFQINVPVFILKFYEEKSDLTNFFSWLRKLF